MHAQENGNMSSNGESEGQAQHMVMQKNEEQKG